MRPLRVSNEREQDLRVLGNPWGDVWPCEHDRAGVRGKNRLRDLDGAPSEQLALGARGRMEMGLIEQDHEPISCVLERLVHGGEPRGPRDPGGLVPGHHPIQDLRHLIAELRCRIDQRHQRCVVALGQLDPHDAPAPRERSSEPPQEGRFSEARRRLNRNPRRTGFNALSELLDRFLEEGGHV
ncbi:hypothetical protein [Polyangium mundeleinium]|uniref:Uncharacterized protein n=1 Tax=Polyangium mundeleinium TaxID=2995306 RepID=A0ABT5EQ34_9BACT|nr:hypothetical protein [Polyangium mundeleinium]MDC0743283.1 hypothetical protein [Polyangium mundeleinium]